MHAVNMLKTK